MCTPKYPQIPRFIIISRIKNCNQFWAHPIPLCWKRESAHGGAVPIPLEIPVPAHLAMSKLEPANCEATKSSIIFPVGVMKVLPFWGVIHGNPLRQTTPLAHILGNIPRPQLLISLTSWIQVVWDESDIVGAQAMLRSCWELIISDRQNLMYMMYMMYMMIISQEKIRKGQRVNYPIETHPSKTRTGNGSWDPIDLQQLGHV